MSGCTETDKRQISILMAVYEPRMDWLRQQLTSLNIQTYPRLRLYIRDDCSPTVPYEQLQSCVRDCITAFPYEIQRNEQNLGSNATFERLTQEAEGEYFAYCDQDDVWLPEKLTVLTEALKQKDTLLVCSDMSVIDGQDNQMADSITKVRRHHRFYSGEHLAKKLLFHNFVTGCTMLVQANAAKTAIPFCPYMVHDNYLALWCAEHGRIQSVLQPLICYRVHGKNQTSLMAGVVDKESYGTIRIRQALDKILWLKTHFPCGSRLSDTIRYGEIWLQARWNYWNGRGGATIIWKYRHFSLLTSIAELLLKPLPNFFLVKAIKLAQSNRV